MRSILPRTSLIGVTQPLRVRDFRLLCGGQSASALGDPLFPFALAFLPLNYGHGAAGVGLLFASRSTGAMPLLNADVRRMSDRAVAGGIKHSTGNGD